MRGWQRAQRRLLKCVFEFGRQLQFEELDYTLLPSGQLSSIIRTRALKFGLPYPNIHFQRHWFLDFYRSITDDELVWAFNGVAGQRDLNTVDGDFLHFFLRKCMQVSVVE